jgi:hypothetical protein
MPLETLAGKAISNTYQKVVQTEGGFLADGTGSIVNNLSLPGNLYVSGTIYANNTITITQSYYSGSNIFGDAQNDTQRFTGSVKITGSSEITGSSLFTYGSYGASSTYIKIDPNVFNSRISFYDWDGGIGSRGGELEMSTYYGRLTYGSYNWFYIGNSSYKYLFYIGDNRRILISDSSAKPTNTSAMLTVRGEGVTNSTTAFEVQNSAGSTNAQIYDDGQWFIGTGNIRVSGTPGNFSFNTAAGNVANIGHWGINFQPLMFSGVSLQLSNNISLTGSTFVTGSLTVTGSGTFTGTITTTGSINAVGGITTDSEASFRTNGITNNTYSRYGIFTFSGWQTGTQTAQFNGWNQESYINSPLNIGIASTTMPARLRVRGSGTTNSTTTLLIENANASASFTVKDDGYIRPYYGINFGSD